MEDLWSLAPTIHGSILQALEQQTSLSVLKHAVSSETQTKRWGMLPNMAVLLSVHALGKSVRHSSPYWT